MRVAFVLLLVAACGNGDTALPIEAQCNPLGINHCMTPWPNAVFEVDDATTMTGRHLAIPATTLPTNITGDQVDPTLWNLADGFSPSAPMVMSFPNGVSVAGLPPIDNMDLSLAADSPTVILDMTTGQRVAHFAEVDAQATGPIGSQALFLRPAQRLIGGHRYAVAITNAVKAADGSDLPIPPGFAALRDGKHTDHALLEAERPRFADVLDALDTAGFAAADLVVAWEFTVASDDFIHRDMIAARDAAVTALDGHTIQYTITSDTPVSATITREIQGTLDAPLFLTNGGDAVQQPVMARGPDGLPAQQGWYQIPFTAIVPTCAYSSPTPVGMVIYGHGLMGDSTETAGGVQQTTASSLCMVFVGTDLRGMSSQDLAAVATALNDGTHADQVMEVLEQGLVNHVTLVRAMRTTFAQTLFVDAANNNKVLVDPTNVVYYGLSQGGILRHVCARVRPHVDARRARRRCRELLDAARSLERLAAVPQHLGSRVSRLARRLAAAVAVPDAVGQDRGRRRRQLGARRLADRAAAQAAAHADGAVRQPGPEHRQLLASAVDGHPRRRTDAGDTVGLERDGEPDREWQRDHHHGRRCAAAAGDQRAGTGAEPEHARPDAQPARDLAPDARLLHDRHDRQRVRRRV